MNTYTLTITFIPSTKDGDPYPRTYAVKARSLAEAESHGTVWQHVNTMDNVIDWHAVLTE